MDIMDNVDTHFQVANGRRVIVGHSIYIYLTINLNNNSPHYPQVAQSVMYCAFERGQFYPFSCVHKLSTLSNYVK